MGSFLSTCRLPSSVVKTQQAPPLEAAADDELLERSKTRSSHSFDESPESFAHTVTEKSFAKTKYNIIKESVDHKSKSNSETNKDLQQTGHSPTNNSLIKTSHNKDLDVAIVGGGITGLYAAYRIAKYASENGISRRVAVFEATGRLGGIVKTVTLGGFNAELGPMRFVLEEQPLFHGLLEELQIETKPFTGYSNSRNHIEEWICVQLVLPMAPPIHGPSTSSPGQVPWTHHLRLGMKIPSL